MRVFIAIELPEAIRGELAALEADLQAAGDSVRWVAPESIHLTLKFVGEVSDARMQDIDDAMKGISWKPFRVDVRGIGFFPGPRSPRVLWVGIQAPPLAALSEKIERRMLQLGFESEKRAFRPHITLARAKDTRLDSSLVTAASAHEEREFGSFLVDRCFLFQSTPQPSGPVYTKLKEYDLNAAREN